MAAVFTASVRDGVARMSPVYPFDDAETARVVVGDDGALVEWNSGAGALLGRLLLELVESRTPGAPVPVLFTLSSWDPEEQDLESYL
ncbi:hypothetical protein ACVNF4_28810, partial [Streptomyces sp. S6]